MYILTFLFICFCCNVMFKQKKICLNICFSYDFSFTYFGPFEMCRVPTSTLLILIISKGLYKGSFLMVNWNIFSHTYTVIHQCHIVFSSRKQVSSVYFIFTEYMIHLFLYLFSYTQIYQSFFQIEKKAPSVSFIFTAYVIHLFPYLYSYTQFNYFVM